MAYHYPYDHDGGARGREGPPHQPGPYPPSRGAPPHAYHHGPPEGASYPPYYGYHPSPYADYWRDPRAEGYPPPSPHYRQAPPPGWYPPRASPYETQPGPPQNRHAFPPENWPEPPRGSDQGKEKKGNTKKEDDKEASEPPDSETASDNGGDNDKNKGKKGDPLSLLAKVSSQAMGPPQKKKQGDESSSAKPEHPEPPVQTSPLRGGPRVSPIVSPRVKRFADEHPPKPITPTTAGLYVTPSDSFEYPRYPARPTPYYRGAPPPAAGPPRRGGPPYYREWPEPPSPAVVEGRSFDSVDSTGSYDARARYHAGYGYYPPHAESFEYASPTWRPPPPTPPHSGAEASVYPPPRWSYGPTPPPGRPGYPPRPGLPPMSRSGSYEDEEYVMPPASYAPYTYVQQPGMREKTVLRKKFSWKHYPELERFLIANRDDYLKHSCKNYTLEQKQYNNWLTEQLIQLATKNNYVFDPEVFNFVSIRDRIRCYYKSFVQTARKRGLALPGMLDKKRQKTQDDEAREDKEKKDDDREEEEEEEQEDAGEEEKDSSSKVKEEKDEPAREEG